MAEKLRKSKTTLIKQTEIFSTLQEHEIKIITQNCEFLKYKTNGPIFESGDQGDRLFIVESGEVLVQKQNGTGKKTAIARFVEGNCFGELDLFTNKKREDSAIAIKDTILLSFPGKGKGFTKILEKHPAISAIILHKILVNIAGRIRSVNMLIKENSPLIQELQKQVYRDKLTGLYNQTYLREQLQRILKMKKNQYALLIMKPDNFKALNDTYGHEAGDLAIKIMANKLREFIGDDNNIARYKGNAIAFIIPESRTKKMEKTAENIRLFMNKLDIREAAKGNPFRITASIGISNLQQSKSNVEDILAETHELPLIGRSRGGNKILFSQTSGIE